jgi:hypothetical protein
MQCSWEDLKLARNGYYPLDEKQATYYCSKCKNSKPVTIDRSLSVEEMWLAVHKPMFFKVK